MTRKLKAKVVTIGNGTGQATVIKELRKVVSDLSVIVGVTDNGGHSGLLREMLHIPAPGDLRNCLSAIMPENNLLTTLMKYRFKGGELSGVSLGNLIMSALIDTEDDIGQATKAICDFLNLDIAVFPATAENTNISASFESGKTIVGEFDIIRRPDKADKIIEMFHTPKVKAYNEAVKAIETADYVIVCPGTLMTGIVSTLLPEGISQAIKASAAKLVLINNVMTSPGQTEGYTSSDHIRIIERYVGKIPDFVLVNNSVIPEFIVELYSKVGAYPVLIDDSYDQKTSIIYDNYLEAFDDSDKEKYMRFYTDRIKSLPHLIRHDAEKVAKTLENIILQSVEIG